MQLRRDRRLEAIGGRELGGHPVDEVAFAVLSPPVPLDEREQLGHGARLV